MVNTRELARNGVGQSRILPKGNGYVQHTLFQGTQDIQTRVFSHRGEFLALFDGFTKMRAVSYVVSSDLLLEFFQKRGYEKIEVVVGDDLTEPRLRQALQGKPIEVLEELGNRVEDGSLSIMVPRRTIHTKLYLLESPGGVRVIQTSANLTETAHKGQQVNYAWFVDLDREAEFWQQSLKDYQDHATKCAPFMDDLVKLLKADESTPKHEVIEAWVSGAAVSAPDSEFAKVVQELAAHSLLTPSERETEVYRFDLPEAGSERRKLEHFLQPLALEISANYGTLDGTAYLNYVEKTCKIPVMGFDPSQSELRVGLGGSLINLSQPLASPEEVNRGLQHIEDYVNTIDQAKSQNPLAAKSNMYEALLYIFFSPFAHKYMQRRRLAFGRIDKRGPRFLYLYGPTQNGKSTFLRFALKLMTGKDIEALPVEEFTRKKILGALDAGTVFPLIFDDIDFKVKPWVQPLLKGYWENWWNPDLQIPQLMLSSNVLKLPDWAKSRVMRIEFDVHFAPTEAEKGRIKELFEHPSSLYQWFTHLYLQRLKKESAFIEDELHVARAVMKDLYDHAARNRPEFFSEEPAEGKFNPGKKRWHDLLYKRKDATMRRENGELLIRFKGTMPWWEINGKITDLPPEVKARREGTTVIIENPDDFDAWCPRPRRWWEKR